VVILAEANSGKSDEFCKQVAQVNESGGFAFFAAIEEELARKPFKTIIGHSERPRFEDWENARCPGLILS
jgi:hypothetical protein